MFRANPQLRGWGRFGLVCILVAAGIGAAAAAQPNCAAGECCYIGKHIKKPLNQRHSWAHNPAALTTTGYSIIHGPTSVAGCKAYWAQRITPFTGQPFP